MATKKGKKPGFFQRLWTNTLTYRIYDFIYSGIQYHKDKNLIADTFYSDEFKLVLKKYLNVEFDKDWYGRLYSVINPNIDIDGNLNFNNVIIEIDGDDTNNNEYVMNWVYRQMNLVGTLFKIERLYDYIDVDFKHVGPANQDNYLVIFDIVSRKIFADAVKKLLKRIFSLGVIAALIVCYFIFFA